MDVHRPRRCRPLLARRERVGVALSHQYQLGAAGADAFDLGLGGNARNVDPRLDLQFAGGVRDRRAMVATGSGDNPRLGHPPQQEIGEGAARFERARLLQKLQLEDQGDVGEAKVAALHLDGRRASDMWTDDRLGSCDLFAPDLRTIHGAPGAPR